MCLSKGSFVQGQRGVGLWSSHLHKGFRSNVFPDGNRMTGSRIISPEIFVQQVRILWISSVIWGRIGLIACAFGATFVFTCWGSCSTCAAVPWFSSTLSASDEHLLDSMCTCTLVFRLTLRKSLNSSNTVVLIVLLSNLQRSPALIVSISGIGTIF